jgi:hypothetical protein
MAMRAQQISASSGECGLKGPEGDRINAVLAAAGYNFALLLRWLEMILRALIVALARTIPTAQAILKSVGGDSSRSTV